MSRHPWAFWVCGLLCCASPTASGQPLVLYDDQLRSGFVDYSYGGGSNFANPKPTLNGSSASISFTGGNFNAVSLAHESQNFATANWPWLRLYVHGGANGGQQLRIYLQLDNVEVASAELDSYIVGATSPSAGVWREVLVPLGSGGLNATHFDRIDLQSDLAGSQPVLYLDAFELLGPASPDPLFADGFDGPGGQPGLPALAYERDVIATGMTGDRYRWRDALGLERSAFLAHNDGQVGPGGSRGGELRELSLPVPGGTRTVRAPSTGAGGFGYVVSHREEGTTGIGGDDSPLGHGFSGSTLRRFAGRHHAIHRYTQLYPRHSRTTANPPNTQYQVPITIEWLIATGRDHPLWAVTWDVSAVPVNALSDDVRAPYGELLFDGAASPAAHSVIAGVGWGDRYRFQSTTSPVTLMSEWTWNTPNTVPYVKLWTTAVDATMGTVLTQTIDQQDAGGYFGTNRWNSTSASGFACTVFGNNYRMPCDFNWPYQAINYSFANPSAATNNTRLAWGSNFGFLGQQSYFVHGSAYWGGPLPNVSASGYPKRSYSHFVVVGTHSAAPVEAQVTQIERVQTMVLTAAIGTVQVNGPGGVGRSDPVDYQPAGWNHVYAAWAVRAVGHALDLNYAIAQGPLRRPMLIVDNWTLTTPPAEVRLDGRTLIADTDYYASIWPETQQLWLTLARDLAGPSHRLEVR